MTIKTADDKGRITLGRGFANQTVVVDDSNPNQLVIRKMVLIPAEEAWLYKNPNALKSVREGLGQSAEMQFSDSPPDVDSDANDAE
jgi:hypothetical protein